MQAPSVVGLYFSVLYPRCILSGEYVWTVTPSEGKIRKQTIRYHVDKCLMSKSILLLDCLVLQFNCKHIQLQTCYSYSYRDKLQRTADLVFIFRAL